MQVGRTLTAAHVSVNYHIGFFLGRLPHRFIINLPEALGRNSMKACTKHLGAVAALLLTSGAANASIVSITTTNTAVASQSGNLIQNGSFETRNAGDPAISSNVNWSGVQGSHIALVQGAGAVYGIPGWTQTSAVGAYGIWGSGAARGGATCADGVACLYFGSWFTTPSVAPVFNANGTVGFSSAPTFSNFSPLITAPTTLSQVLSGLVVGNDYLLDFWASGEDNTTSRILPGVFGLSIGSDSVYLTAPSTGSVFNSASIRYNVKFKATSSIETLSFMNWGHVTTSSTELILDDVRLNAIPEPNALALAALALSAIVLVGARSKAC